MKQQKRENAYYPSSACGGCDPCVLVFSTSASVPICIQMRPHTAWKN